MTTPVPIHHSIHCLEAGRTKLRQAYVLVSFGFINEALEICEEVAVELPDHPIAPTLKGAFLIASGQPQAALKHLAKVMRRHPRSALTRLYFCEACLLSGRGGRGLKELQALDEDLLDTQDLRLFADSLKQVFEDIDPSMIPAPLIVCSPSEEA